MGCVNPKSLNMNKKQQLVQKRMLNEDKSVAFYDYMRVTFSEGFLEQSDKTVYKEL